MQNTMRKTFTISILAVFLIVSQALATHSSSVSISPTESMISTDIEFKLKVSNQAGDSITSVELQLPEPDGDPYYLIKDVASPAGWTYVLRNKIDSSYPYKITWSSTAGIAEGKSMEFGFTAQSPSTLGDFTWTWRTVDTKGDVKTDTIMTKTILAPFASFKIVAPETAKAGEYFNAVLSALDKDGNVKTDFTGTVSFTSSDKLAILSPDYTFVDSDKGSKEFTFKLKTAGSQTIEVKSDSKTASSEVLVSPADAVAVMISLEKGQIAPADVMQVSVSAVDVFGNEFDVTNESKFIIDEEAGGKFTDNFYEAGNEGTWNIIATYTFGDKTLTDGTVLTVSKAAVPEEKPVEEEPEEKPVEEEPKEELVGQMSISLPEEVIVRPGKNATVTLKVRNIGTLDLTDVIISFEGAPESWIRVQPLLADIKAGASYGYSVEVKAPESETGVKAIKFFASSNENTTASKEMTLNVVEKVSITGWIVAFVTKPLYLGIIIVILIILILIIRAMIPKKKKKSEE